MEEKELKLRMYFFTVSSLQGISQGIMCGHAALRYARLFSEKDPQVWQFVDNHETWVILNGGTTNSEYDFDGTPKGSLNQIAESLHENDIQFSYFVEPDLNNALSAVCFITDERVFNRKDYPEFQDYLVDVKNLYDAEQKFRIYRTPIDVLKEKHPDEYKEWVRLIGGVKNVFLRELLRDKKKA
jgi:hypothetical protein